MQHCRPEDAAQWFLCLWGTCQAVYTLIAWAQLPVTRSLVFCSSQGAPVPVSLEARERLREGCDPISVNAP